MSGCDKQLILIKLFAVKSMKVCLFWDFQGLQPKFKDFPGPGIFFCHFQDFPRVSRSVATLFTTFGECKVEFS